MIIHFLLSLYEYFYIDILKPLSNNNLEEIRLLIFYYHNRKQLVGMCLLLNKIVDIVTVIDLIHHRYI